MTIFPRVWAAKHFGWNLMLGLQLLQFLVWRRVGFTSKRHWKKFVILKKRPVKNQWLADPLAKPLRYLDKSGVSKDKLEEAALQSSTNPFLVTKRGWAKAGWGSLRWQVQTWFGGPQFELTVWSHGSTRNHGPGSSHFTISDRSILLNLSKVSRGNFAQWMLLVLQLGAPVGAPVGVVGQFSPSGDLNVQAGRRHLGSSVHGLLPEDDSGSFSCVSLHFRFWFDGLLWFALILL